MTDYTPNKWAVIKIATDGLPLHKVFGSWYGGFLNGDSWRLNSGVKSVSLEEDQILFEGFSGSTYYCHKDGYGMTAFSRGVMLDIIDRAGVDIIVLDENTDWLNLKEEINAENNH